MAVLGFGTREAIDDAFQRYYKAFEEQWTVSIEESELRKAVRGSSIEETITSSIHEVDTLIDDKMKAFIDAYSDVLDKVDRLYSDMDANNTFSIDTSELSGNLDGVSLKGTKS